MLFIFWVTFDLKFQLFHLHHGLDFERGPRSSYAERLWIIILYIAVGLNVGM